MAVVLSVSGVHGSGVECLRCSWQWCCVSQVFMNVVLSVSGVHECGVECLRCS